MESGFEERSYRGEGQKRSSQSRQMVVLPAIPHNTLESLIDFIYSGKLSLSQDNVQDILVAADMIQLTEVVEICTEFLKTELHQTNAVGIYRFADGHNIQGLKEVALHFIFDNFCAVSGEEEFLEIDKELLSEFISSEFLQVDSEYQVFVSAMTWINYDITNR